MNTAFFVIAALLGAVGVGAGAFGAHALSDLLMETGRTDTFETAVRYQMYHVFALLVVAFLQLQWRSSTWLTWSGWLFVAGIIIFSGSLYLLIFTGQRWLGAVTPLGGVAFLGGWFLLAAAAWQQGG